MTGHEPLGREKTGYLYNDALEPHSPHPLFLFDCSCGHRGSVWYASLDRAMKSFDRHVPVRDDLETLAAAAHTPAPKAA